MPKTFKGVQLQPSDIFSLDPEIVKVPLSEREQINLILKEEQTEFARLCYDAFIVSHSGRRLWELIVKRYLLNNPVDASRSTCTTEAIFNAGFREAFLGLYRFAENHKAQSQGVNDVR